MAEYTMTVDQLIRYLAAECVGDEPVTEELLEEARAAVTAEPERYAP